MATTFKAAAAFHWFGHTYAADDVVDTTGYTQHAMYELLLNCPVYAVPSASSLDPDLTTIAALDSTQAGVIASDGSGWTRKTFAALKSSLSLVVGDVSGAVASSDSRLTDARTPTAHATSHNHGGSDLVTPQAGDVSNTVSGLSVVTHTNVQSAIADLDGAAAIAKVNGQISPRQVAFRPTGATYETYPRHLGINWTPTAMPTSGKLMLQGIYLPAGLVVNSFSFVTGTTAASGPTHWWCGLYDSSRVQLAVSADQTTTALSASTQYTLPVANVAAGAASSFTTTYEGLYYVGMMVAVSTTMPNVYCATQSSAIGTVPLLTGGSTTGQTGTPAFPFTAGAMTAGTFGFYMFLG